MIILELIPQENLIIIKYIIRIKQFFYSGSLILEREEKI